MIDNDTEIEILVSAYTGQGGSYQVTYDARFDTLLVERKYSDAIRSLEAKDLINVTRVYPTNTSAWPAQYLCCLTRRGVKYVEDNKLRAFNEIEKHQQARKLIQEIADAEKAGDIDRKDELHTSFRHLDIEVQSAAKQYEHLK